MAHPILPPSHLLCLSLSQMGLHNHAFDNPDSRKDHLAEWLRNFLMK